MRSFTSWVASARSPWFSDASMPDVDKAGRRGIVARIIAAVAIASFWCMSAVGTTVFGTTVGLTTLAATINAAISTPTEARQRWRRGCRGRRPWRGRRWRGEPERFGIWFGGC